MDVTVFTIAFLSILIVIMGIEQRMIMRRYKALFIDYEKLCKKHLALLDLIEARQVYSEAIHKELLKDS
jgi:hypothetical protein